MYEKRSVTIKNGKIERIVGICQDITERVLSGQSLTVTKQLLSNTLSNIQDGFVILDENSNYLYVNNLAADLLDKNIEYLIILKFDLYKKNEKVNSVGKLNIN